MKYGKLIFFSAVALISTVTIRFLQLLFLTDLKSGFFLENCQEIGTYLSIWIALFIAVTALLAYITGADRILPFFGRSNALFLVALLAGVTQIGDALFGQTALPLVPTWMLFLRWLCILACGLTFLWFGLSGFFGWKPYAPLSMVFVVAWIIRLITTFIGFSGMSNISENLYDVMMLIFTLLFFLSHGRVLCGIARKREMQTLLVTGVSAVLCTAVSAVPNIVMPLIRHENLAHTPTDHPIPCLFTALYIAVFLVKISRDTVKNT